jgi:hypothetical protein
LNIRDVIWATIRSGSVVIGIATLHCFAGAFIIKRLKPIFWDTLKDNYGFNAVSNDCDRSSSAWFQLAGLSWILVGWFMNRYEHDTQRPLPSELGHALLGISAIGAYLMPKGGFYLFIVPCSMILKRARKSV